MVINQNWDFKELVNNLKMLKQEYDEVLAFFLSYNNSTKYMNVYIKEIRDKFYGLNLKEWQIDLCWEYMNGYKLYQEVARITKKMDK